MPGPTTFTRRALTIHIHVPRRCWQGRHHPVQLLGQFDLASQSRAGTVSGKSHMSYRPAVDADVGTSEHEPKARSRVLKPKCQVQHIVLLIIRFGQHIVVLRVDDNMACRARDGPITRPYMISAPGTGHRVPVSKIDDRR
jgi:hypothetical protein